MNQINEQPYFQSHRLPFPCSLPSFSVVIFLTSSVTPSLFLPIFFSHQSTTLPKVHISSESFMIIIVEPIMTFFTTLTRLIFAEINFRVDLFSRMPKSLFFAWIYFRGWSNLSNFAWIYFRQTLYLKELFCSYLCLNKHKNLNDLDMKIVYIFPQRIYNKYYTCDLRKYLLCESLSLLSSFKCSKMLEVLLSQKVM